MLMMVDANGNGRESDSGTAKLASEAETQMQLQLGNATSLAFNAFCLIGIGTWYHGLEKRFIPILE